MPRSYEEAIRHLADDGEIDTSEDYDADEWENEEEWIGTMLGGEWDLMAFIYDVTPAQVIRDVIARLKASGHIN